MPKKEKVLPTPGFELHVTKCLVRQFSTGGMNFNFFLRPKDLLYSGFAVSRIKGLRIHISLK